jgi:hypothetical protein
MLYKQHVIDEYYEEKAKEVREAIGFYWAVRTRDNIQNIGDAFIKTLDVVQDIDPDTGNFYEYSDDDFNVNSQDFMDYMDVAMFNSINECNQLEIKDNYKDDFTTKELQKLTFNLLDNNFEKYEKLSIEEKKNYVRQCLWNHDDFKESFQFSLKKFTNELIQKFMIIPYEDSEFLEEPEDFKCTVKEIYELINAYTELNKGMPAKRDEEDKHSEESLELISKAMFSSSFIDYVVNYIVEEVK